MKAKMRFFAVESLQCLSACARSRPTCFNASAFPYKRLPLGKQFANCDFCKSRSNCDFLFEMSARKKPKKLPFEKYCQFETVLAQAEEYDKNLDRVYATEEIKCREAEIVYRNRLTTLSKVRDRYAKINRQPIGQKYLDTAMLPCEFKCVWDNQRKCWNTWKRNCAFTEPGDDEFSTEEGSDSGNDDENKSVDSGKF